jgi:hypothetical protein
MGILSFFCQCDQNLEFGAHFFDTESPRSGDPERKASMISNLLVVLVSDKDASPVVNTGSLYG